LAKVQSLVQDIEGLLDDRDIVISEEASASFGEEIAGVIRDRLGNKTHTPALRLSNLGTVCKRKLWYAINKPDLAEPLSPSTRLKFLFGDILESLLLFLAGLAGHKVERRQEEVDVEGVKGHIDAVIDDELVDVKSASSFSFAKFASGGLRDNDSFGYITQLESYGQALGKKHGHFLVVDKTLGHICLDSHTLQRLPEGTVQSTKAFLSRPIPPARAFSDEADGLSGNRKLGIACSYCQFKTTCWPGLQVYNYAGRPRWLTRVVREPRVSRG
jgi:hypothetical protein